MSAVDLPPELPLRLKSEISRIVRDSKLVREIKVAHDYTCQVCGTKLELAPGRFYAEAHHLKPLGHPHNGPDVKANLLCVCPNCHVKLDFTAMKIDMSMLITVRGHRISEEYIDYHNTQCSPM
jgi:predicted restriction endonuclease